MLKGLLGAILKVTDPAPHYMGERCLVERQVVGGCDRCQAACPHDAVVITDHVEILDDACTGCGLCVQACPSGALEYDLLPVLGALKDQGVSGAVGEAGPVSASLKCSKVPGDGATVQCLARVSPAEVLAGVAWGQELILIHADCASCRLGGPDVPRSLQNVLEIAREYRKHLTSEPLPARMVQWGGEKVETSPLEVAPPVSRPAVSRREAMGALFGGAKRATAQVIPDQVLPGISTRLEASRIPDEWVWRRRALRPRPVEAAPQYWPAPSVDDRCIMCPVCETVCPTDAISRTLDESGGYTLSLELAACTGCNACVVSCPPDAMKLEPYRPFGELARTVVLHEGDGT